MPASTNDDVKEVERRKSERPRRTTPRFSRGDQSRDAPTGDRGRTAHDAQSTTTPRVYLNPRVHNAVVSRNCHPHSCGLQFRTAEVNSCVITVVPYRSAAELRWTPLPHILRRGHRKRVECGSVEIAVHTRKRVAAATHFQPSARELTRSISNPNNPNNPNNNPNNPNNFDLAI